MASPTMSDFDADEFLTSVYPGVGVGGLTSTSTFDDLFPPSTAGVGIALSPTAAPQLPPPSSTTSLGTVGVGTLPPRRTTVSTRTLSAGKQPRRRFAGKWLPCWTFSPNIPIIATSRSSTCVRTCFLRANLPRAFLATLITSWLSRIPGINWACATWPCRRFPTSGRRCWTPFATRRRDPLVIWCWIYIRLVATIKGS